MVALSFSTTAIASPALTSSPGCFNHSVTSTSSAAIPEAGMKISSTYRLHQRVRCQFEAGTEKTNTINDRLE
jgi:hypothetical protein